MKLKLRLIMLFAMVIAVAMPQAALAKKVENPRWNEILSKYEQDDDVNSLIFVKHKSGSKADVVLYTKEEGEWKIQLASSGYVGKRGINKKRMGDSKTPTGTFGIRGAFGIKPKPKTRLKYVKVNKYHRWCGDRSKHFNTLVDTRKVRHRCTGEHLIDYKVSYDYGMFMDYNAKKVRRKGSAIFFHCTNSKPYTAGCISVKKKYMLQILKQVDKNVKICVYPKKVVK